MVVDIWDQPCTAAEINLFGSFFDGEATTKRKGIPGTLHRVSLITHPLKNPVPVLGVAVRVGRALQGLMETMTGGVRVFLLVEKYIFYVSNLHSQLSLYLKNFNDACLKYAMIA